MTVTPDIINAHLETDRTDAVIQRLISDAESDIDRRYGDRLSRTQDWRMEAGRRRIYLVEKATSLTTVQEGATIDNLTTLTVTTDYQLVLDSMAIERIDVDWQERVRVTWVPVDDESRRDRVTIDLVKLALVYDGLQAEGDGGFRMTHLDYQPEREKILSALNGGRRTFA